MNEEVVRVDPGILQSPASYGRLLRKSPQYTFELADDLFRPVDQIQFFSR